MFVNFLIPPSPKTHLSSAQTSPSTFLCHRATASANGASASRRQGLEHSWCFHPSLPWTLVKSLTPLFSPLFPASHVVRASQWPCFIQAIAVSLGPVSMAAGSPQGPWLRPCPPAYNPGHKVSACLAHNFSPISWQVCVLGATCSPSFYLCVQWEVSEPSNGEQKPVGHWVLPTHPPNF